MTVVLVVAPLSFDISPLSLAGLDLAPLLFARSDLKLVLLKAAALVAIGTAHHSAAD